MTMTCASPRSELGAVKLTDLKASRVDAFLRKMAADGYSASVLQQTRRVLVRSIRQAQRDDLVGKNVAELVKCPAAKTRRSRSMTVDQARQLLGSDLSTWWRGYFTLALWCGLRPGEITGLRWSEWISPLA